MHEAYFCLQNENISLSVSLQNATLIQKEFKTKEEQTMRRTRRSKMCLKTSS